MDTAKDWELHAENNPYWAVVTWDKFRTNVENDPTLLEEFFQTGVRHVDAIFRIIESSLVSNFSPKTALDFGCGVGRLVVPLAQRGITVSGVDIARAMLAKTKRNLETRHLSAAALVSDLGQLPAGRYDLVHSFVVLQHIPVANGMEIIKSLLEKVNDDGVAVLHVSYLGDETLRSRVVGRATTRIKQWISHRARLAAFIGRLRGHAIRPPMLMENYPLNKVFLMLGALGFANIHIRHSNHGGAGGLVIFAQRNPEQVQEDRF